VYTIIFAVLMELAIIPISFGALTSIMLGKGAFFYVVWGIAVYTILCLYVFLVMFISGYRHYTKSWRFLRLFYTQNTYIEWY
jgi:hypothetical protein